MAELFDLVRGPAAGVARWRGLLVCAIDGTTLFVPDSGANAAAFGRQTGRPEAPGGYPMLRLLTIVACGSRTIIDAVFGSYRVGETSYAPRMLGSLRPGMVLLADRNFASAALIQQIADTGAHLLIRCKNGRRFPVIRPLGDGTWIALMGATRVRIIDATIRVELGPGSGRYRTEHLPAGHDPDRPPAVPSTGPGRPLSPAVGDRDRLPGSQVDPVGPARPARSYPGRCHPRGLCRADRAPGPARRDGRRCPGQRQDRTHPAQFHHRAEYRTRRDLLRDNNSCRTSHRPHRADRHRGADQPPTRATITIKSQDRQTRDLQAPSQRSRRQDELHHHDHDTPTRRRSLTPRHTS